MLVQDYLLGGKLIDLKVDHAINYRISACGRKVSLNYDMLEASNADPVASQCRGAILCLKNGAVITEDAVLGDTNVLCRPMDRFFNHGQGEAALINFACKNTKFYEKMDGTMCAMYYDPFHKKWCVATRAVPDADLPMDGFGNMTYSGLFEKAALETTGYKTFDDWIGASNLASDMTYVFELCTPANRVVVEHFNYGITLLAVRRNHTGMEFSIEAPGHAPHNVPLCATYSIGSLEDMIEFVSKRDPSRYEGVVAVDANFKRVKVKNPGYHALGRIKDAACSSPRALVELCLLGTLDDTLSLLPDYIVSTALEIKDALVEIIRNADASYDTAIAELEANTAGLEHAEVRKQLALICARDELDMAYIMRRWSGGVENYRAHIEMHRDKKNGAYKKPMLAHLFKMTKVKFVST